MFKFRAIGSFGAVLSLSLSILMGCDKEVASDGGAQDSGPADAGPMDAGNQDGGLMDAGNQDAGLSDAGFDGGPGDGGDAGQVPTVSLDFVSVSTPVGLTANGSTALLQDLLVPDSIYFYDTTTHQLSLKTTTGEQEAAYGIAGNGSRIIGSHGSPIQASLWSEAEGWQDLGSPFDAGCDPDDSVGWGLDYDGTVAVGLVFNGCASDAFRWTGSSDGGTFTILEKLGAGTIDGGSDRATVVSADGTTMAGFVQTGTNDRTPAIWWADGGGLMIDSVQAGPGEVLAIGTDGRMVAGVVNLDGFYWTQDAGLIDIGKLPTSLPTDTTYLNAIAAKGQLIFGGCGDPFGGGVQAIVWTADGGMQPLQPIAAAQGVNIPSGYVLSDIVSSSEDGTTLLGYGLDTQMMQSSFVLRLPVSAYGITSGP
jgi:hypothetical protein